jgi:hypothetical protein
MYVREHSLRATRRLRFVGTLAALLSLVAALAWEQRLLWLVPVVGYGFAWWGHFFVERNRPATFPYPLWSLAGDCKMFWLMLRGRMDAEVTCHARVGRPSDNAIGGVVRAPPPPLRESDR